MSCASDVIGGKWEITGLVLVYFNKKTIRAGTVLDFRLQYTMYESHIGAVLFWMSE